MHDVIEAILRGHMMLPGLCGRVLRCLPRSLEAARNKKRHGILIAVHSEDVRPLPCVPCVPCNLQGVLHASDTSACSS
jgi:hypothetical protein